MSTTRSLLLPSKSKASERSFFKKLGHYVYVYVELGISGGRAPIYIGKGSSDRCMAHLEPLESDDDPKAIRISQLAAGNRLGIDILAYDLDESEAFKIEAACIDLMGIDVLANKVRGKAGETVKRLPIGDLYQLLGKDRVAVREEHKGLAILINRDFQPTFGRLELFEITRGIWPKKLVTLAERIEAKYAYATYQGIVKEVYEIQSWVPAGTQQYFSRELDPERLKANRWEFVGRIAPEKIRSLYVGSIIDRPRSYGDPFVKVGFVE
jgi:uncharacterized protein